MALLSWKKTAVWGCGAVPWVLSSLVICCLCELGANFADDTSSPALLYLREQRVVGPAATNLAWTHMRMLLLSTLTGWQIKRMIFKMVQNLENVTNTGHVLFWCYDAAGMQQQINQFAGGNAPPVADPGQPTNAASCRVHLDSPHSSALLARVLLHDQLSGTRLPFPMSQVDVACSVVSLPQNSRRLWTTLYRALRYAPHAWHQLRQQQTWA